MGNPARIIPLAALLGCLCVPVAQCHADDVSGDIQALLQSGRESLEINDSVSAENAFRMALEKMDTANVPSETVVHALIALSTACLEQGKISQAERALLKAGLLKAEPVTAVELANNWAVVHAKLGREQESRTELMQALAQYEVSPDAKPVLPSLLDNLASAEIHLGEYPDAVGHLQRAIVLWREFLPTEHPVLAKWYASLSTAQYLAGSPEAAHSSMETAIGIAQRAYGKHDHMVASLIQSEMVILTRLGLKKEIKARRRELSQMGLAALPSSATYTLAATR